jgi:hypothetical protein
MASSLAFRLAERIDETLRAAARDFYLEVLRGREIRWPERPGAERLFFLVGHSLIETGPGVPAIRAPSVIFVDEVEETAARCWDAGFTVDLSFDASALPSFTLIDPFGRQIELVQRTFKCGVTLCH